MSCSKVLEAVGIYSTFLLSTLDKVLEVMRISIPHQMQLMAGGFAVRHVHPRLCLVLLREKRPMAKFPVQQIQRNYLLYVFSTGSFGFTLILLLSK
eukprot:g66100.t1